MSHRSQQEAIQKETGPCVILAGAGTGKTYTIVEKIRHLIEKKVYDPQKIVCLTFSNEAVNALRVRTLNYLKEQDQEPIIRTFHSFCADLLREHGEKIGVPSDFRIIVPDDAKILLHKHFKLQPHLCHTYISELGIAKDIDISLESLEEYVLKKTKDDGELESMLQELQFKFQMLYNEKDPEKKKEKTAIKERIDSLDSIIKTKKFLQAWKGYEKMKKQKKFLDYSDLNKHVLKLLEDHPQIAQEYEYVIVDEFQDTNKLQCDFLEKIAPHKNITVVGDLNQSIYRFRGAYKENFKQFKKMFNVQEKDIFALDRSFRSTNKILSIAHQLIENNYEDKTQCFPVYSAYEKEGKEISAFELKNGKEEVRKIVEIIKEKLNDGESPEEICVLFRTHQQARMLKSSLEYENVPFTSTAKKSLLKASQIKVAQDYLMILHKLKQKEKGGEQAWWDLIYNSGFSKEDIVRMSAFIKEKRDVDCISVTLLNTLASLELSEQGKTKAKILVQRIKQLIPSIEKPLPELLLKIYEIAGFGMITTENGDTEQVLILQKFYELVTEYAQMYASDLQSFIHHLEAIHNLGIEIESPNMYDKGVRIMTAHATKGLEYKTVIVGSLAQKRFPIEKITKSLIPSVLSPEIAHIVKHIKSDEEIKEIVKKYEQKNQLLEERRLCYVAFTRAKEELIVTYAKEYNNKKVWPSQFLNELSYKNNEQIKVTIDNEEKYKKPEFENQLSTVKLQDKNKTKELVFSPSSLQLFDQCQKRYEYRYVYNMPEPEPVSWEALRLGSFVHRVFEEGVRQVFKTEKEFFDVAKTLQMEEKWNFIDLEEANQLIKVFFYRNKDKYTKDSLTEQKLFTMLKGVKFMGIADRIDKNAQGFLEIIDYKTGASAIKPKYRDWQLGFYALAATKYGVPKKVTLDMLRKDKPLEFEIDNKGVATEIHSGRMSFDLSEVEDELVETANKIKNAHEIGFEACAPEKNCQFCNEYVWER